MIDGFQVVYQNIQSAFWVQSHILENEFIHEVRECIELVFSQRLVIYSCFQTDQSHHLAKVDKLYILSFLRVNWVHYIFVLFENVIVVLHIEQCFHSSIFVTK